MRQQCSVDGKERIDRNARIDINALGLQLAVTQHACGILGFGAEGKAAVGIFKGDRRADILKGRDTRNDNALGIKGTVKPHGGFAVFAADTELVGKADLIAPRRSAKRRNVIGRAWYTCIQNHTVDARDPKRLLRGYRQIDQHAALVSGVCPHHMSMVNRCLINGSIAACLALQLCARYVDGSVFKINFKSDFHKQAPRSSYIVALFLTSRTHQGVRA